MEVQSFDDIYLRLKSNMIANCDSVTDYNDGSIIRSIFEAIATVGHRFYVDTKLGYDNNLRAIPYALFDFQRLEGQKATGEVKFKSSKAISSDTVIPSGTKIASGDLIYYTTEQGLIPANSLSSNGVSIQADEIGSKYNVLAGSISTILSYVSSNVSEVVNDSKIKGGLDEESDAAYLARFKNYINGLQGCNIYGIKTAVTSILGVRSCAVKEHFPLKNDIFGFTVYIDDGNGGLSDNLKSKIQASIDGDETVSNPGKKAAGIKYDIQAADPVSINLVVTTSVYQVEPDIAKTEIENAIKEYIASLKIGESVYMSNLIVAVKQLSYVRSAKVVSTREDEGDYVLDVSQLAQAGTITVTATSI